MFGKTLTKVCNNSAWNNDHNFYQQSIQDVIKILIDFLGEFLLFLLKSIIECKQFYSQFQQQKLIDIAERIHQLRLTLLIQINNTNQSKTNSPILNIPSISQILHELASCIHCLDKEQQQIGTIIEHPQTIMLTQLLDRLEKILRSCMDCVNIHRNPQVGQQFLFLHFKFHLKQLLPKILEFANIDTYHVFMSEFTSYD
jgi:hypothetical protein